MRTLVLFFSRTGRTLALANRIASGLGAETEALQDQRKWSGLFGAINAGRMALFGGRSRLMPVRSNLPDYDLVVIGTPVWAGQPSVPVRTFLQDRKSDLSDVAFFCTQDGDGGEAVMDALEILAGRPPIASLIESQVDRDNGQSHENCERFIEDLRKFIDGASRLRAAS